MPGEVLVIQSRRVARVKRGQIAQHMIAAIVLASAGFNHLQQNRTLAILEIAAGALLIGAVLVEKIRHRHRTAGRVAWVELAGAIMLTIEAVEKTQEPHHALFYVLLFVQPLALLAFALFDAELASLRTISIDDRAMRLRTGVLFRQRVARDKIHGYRIDGDRIDLGGGSLNLSDVVDRDAAKAWIVDVLRRRGLQPLPAQQLPGGEGGAEKRDADQVLVAENSRPE